MKSNEELRFKRTYELLSRFVSRDELILDLGTPNELSSFLKTEDYKIESAFGFDFDLEPEKLNEYDYGVLTAFEVLEHLVSPFHNVSSASAGDGYSMILATDSTLWVCGFNHNGELGDGTATNRSVPVKIMRQVQKISAGYNVNLVLKADGTLWAYGYSKYGEIGNTCDREPLSFRTPVQIILPAKQL